MYRKRWDIMFVCVFLVVGNKAGKGRWMMRERERRKEDEDEKYKRFKVIRNENSSLHKT